MRASRRLLSGATPETTTFPAAQLHDFCRRVFESFGVPPEDATLAAEVLSVSDRRGIDSHGVARMYSYVGMLRAGRINPRPELSVVRETASTATVDGDNGLGLVVGPRANEMAMDKADEAGSGWVSVRNTNHYGIAGYYSLEALDRGMIGLSMTNTTALVTPMFGRERVLGTNAMAIAFPGAEEPPIVIDMATCAAAYGKIEIAARHGQPIPVGWALAPDGADTQDPRLMMREGALLPLGSTRELGGHKGFCLAAMVDMLTAVLSGANWGPYAPPFTVQQETPEGEVGKGIGHFFGAMRVDGFIDPAEFGAQVDHWRRVLRATLPAGAEAVVIPGDPEVAAEEERARTGIPLVGPVVEDLREIERVTGVVL